MTTEVGTVVPAHVTETEVDGAAYGQSKVGMRQ